ncbi:hypothetical protein AVEN_225995-1 [Araneus ventricosus]|uniref:Reverse transcriptase domain-containing protein n=1 Tax=Araneus ventricosus TaxID=182803 RepID=A0A4Y2N7Z4_ARAVE|nr:hypothetical protein AVEN_225995-1 [Araneus ventricosus]
MYADDTAIMITGISQHLISENLNIYLAELGKWLIKWKVMVNVGKSREAILLEGGPSLPLSFIEDRSPGATKLSIWVSQLTKHLPTIVISPK